MSSLPEAEIKSAYVIIGSVASFVSNPINKYLRVLYIVYLPTFLIVLFSWQAENYIMIF